MRPPAPNTPTLIIDRHATCAQLKVSEDFADNHYVGELGEMMRDVPRQPVTFDRDSQRLAIGDRSTVVPDSAAGNEAMLRSYLALVAEVRGTLIGSGIEVRHDDVVVLAEILDLDDSDLEVHLANLLGVSANDAADVHRRIRRHRARTAVATLTVGGLALLGATNVSMASPAPARPAPLVGATTSEPEVTTATTVVATDTPELPDPSPKPHTHPRSSDDVQIGDALVIERGQQPDDPTTQVGDAVTYER
jgi:hypothetical protein